MIVVSILASDVATLRARALGQLPFADAIELRLDELPHVTLSELRELISALAKPVIAAVNGPDAFGTFNGTRTERFALLERAAHAGAAFVDVDWREAPHQPSLPKSCRRIVSRHVLEGTPTDLAGAFADVAAAARAEDLPKFVTHAHSAEDGVRLLEHARTLTRDFIAFASGERGSFTRVLAPIFGSRFTYAAPARVAGVDSGAATAPGQLRADVLRSMLPMSGLTHSTEIFAVVGLPARHSLSPRLFNAVFRHSARDAVYCAVEPDDLAAFIPLCRADNWRGFSVTAPFKEVAFALAIRHADPAKSAGAANTLTRLPDGWAASNMDILAVRKLLEDTLLAERLSPAARVLVVGSGGAARAAVAAARELGLTSLCVTSRNEHHAAEFARVTAVRALSRAELETEPVDVLIHCTPAGSRAAPNEIAIPPAVLRRARIVIEAVYRPRHTPLVDAARAGVARVVLGQEWFLEQAVLQALCFAPGCTRARAWMETELERALAEEGT